MQLLKSSRRLECKCHGVSGSCAVKTCWFAMPEIRHIADQLGQLYHSAEPVRMRRAGSRDRLLISSPTGPTLASSQSLVYSSPSPDYCSLLPPLQFNGTSGRACSDPNSCRHLCCGRGHVVRIRTYVDARCSCKFQYCCYVTCQSCVRTVRELVCL